MEQGTTILLQEDVGVDDGKTTTAQTAAREESARPPKNRQQQRVASWGATQTKQFDPALRATEKLLLFCRDECLSHVLLFAHMSCVL